MPKRVVDGESLWTSDKLSQVEPESFRAEYANLLPLATGNGTFECEPKKVWRQVYSYNRPSVTLDHVVAILDAFERAKLLFRWQAANGKWWGFWVGIDKPGRLPPASRTNHEKRGPTVPFDKLTNFLTTESSKLSGNEINGFPTVASGYPLASDWLTSGCQGNGTGKGRGIGSGGGSADAESPSVTEATASSPDSFSSLRTSKDRPLATAVEEAPAGGAGGVAPASKAKVNQKYIPAGSATMPVKAASRKIANPSPDQQQAMPESLPQLDEPFDALDFAMERTKPFAGYDPKVLRRIVFYACKVAKPYWSLPQAKIDSPARLEKVLATMAEQMPPDFKVPGSATLSLPRGNPSCVCCGGQGRVVAPNPAYEGALAFHSASLCTCVTYDTRPWRQWIKSAV
jgi:hypothetical protein